MPAIAIPLASAVATAAGTGIAFTIAGFSVTYGSLISAAISIGGSFLTSSKSKGGVSTGSTTDLPLLDTGRKVNAANPTDFRTVVYGQTRKEGTFLFTKTTSSGVNNLDERNTSRDAYLHQIIAYAGHPCTEFVNLYLNNQLLTLDADGWVQNTAFTENSDTEAAKAADTYAATLDTTANASGSGTTATVLLDTALATVQSFIGAGDLIKVAGFSDTAYNGQFEVTVVADAGGGQTNVTYETDTTITTASPSQLNATLDLNPVGYRGSIGYVYTSGGHDLSGSDKVYVFNADPDQFNSEKQTVDAIKTTRTFTYDLDADNLPTEVATVASYQRRNGTDRALVNVQTFLGSESQDLSANTFIGEALPGQFTSTDNFKGICCSYVRFYDAAEFDESPQLTAEIKGKSVFDPRDGTFKYTSNAALCILDYLTGDINGTPYGPGYNLDTVGNTSTDINLTSFSTEADRCDESVELSGGSYTRRYKIDGTVSTGEQFIDNITLLAASMMGNLSIYDGKVNIWSAHYEIPTHHVNEEWFASDGLQLTVNNDKQNLINSVTGVINNEAELYNADDFPKYSDAAAIAEDGEELSDDLQMPFVKNIETAQRLAKIYEQSSRQKQVIETTLNARALMFVPNDTVFLSFDKYNLVNAVFKVVKLSINLQDLTVNVTLKQDDSSVYEWAASEAA